MKEASTLQNIGSIYRELGDATRSIEFLNQSLAVSRSFGDREIEGYSLLYLKVTIIWDSRRQSEVYNQALLIAREIGSQKLEIDALASLGFVFYRLGELQNALNYYNQALPVYRAMGDKEGEAILLVQYRRDLQRARQAAGRDR